MPHERPPWNDYFMAIAAHAAKRSSCRRAQVGCVLVNEHRIIATGYNGSIAGEPHCLDVGCDLHQGRCVRCIHAEQNAICDAALRGVSVKDCVAYVTHSPCWVCFKLLLQAGVCDIVYLKPYTSPVNDELIKAFCVKFQRQDPNG